LLLLGFAGALRRSELVALDIEDIELVDDGLKVLVRRSKTDQEGEGRIVAMPFGSDPATCPVRSLRRWLDVAGIAEGAVFHRERGDPVDQASRRWHQAKLGGAGHQTRGREIQLDSGVGRANIPGRVRDREAGAYHAAYGRLGRGGRRRDNDWWWREIEIDLRVGDADVARITEDVDNGTPILK
jgi:integrase